MMITDYLEKESGLLEKIKNDKERPKYHFCALCDLGFPFDPNAPFFYNGMYHMFYIYESRNDSYRWAHSISEDLLHWTPLPDALIPDENDGGIYSGGVYLKDDTAYVIYWALGKDGKPDGIRIAKSVDDKFINWQKIDGQIVTNVQEGVANILDKNGNLIEIGSADPSNIWECNGKYYMVLGNLCLLNKYRESKEIELGDHGYLFESDDLINWQYLHEFYDRKKDNSFTDESEDFMCPFFGKIPNSDKYILLFLAHNRGTQYYIGDYDTINQKFIIEKHGRMSFVDNCLFAPEAMYTPDGRLLSFYWQRDNQDDDLKRELEKGWSGIHSIPRELFLHENGVLGIKPLRELKNLRNNIISNSKVTKETLYTKKDFDTDCCEIIIKNIEKTAGVSINLGNNGTVFIYLDLEKNQLVYDLTESNSKGRKVKDIAPIDPTFKNQYLQIFIDKCSIEVFVSEHQAISRQVFDTNPNNREISFIGNNLDDVLVDIYDISPTNIY